MKRILLLGHTGKMGTALGEVLAGGYTVIGKNSTDFDAADLDAVSRLVEQARADIVINTVSFVGIDACEKDPQKAWQVNTLFPRRLAELSLTHNFLFVHFSTDAVFHDRGSGFYTEDDCARPVNTYGFTKYGADCFIQAIASDFYVVRISILFGESNRNHQFVEKMLQKAREGASVLKIADDIIVSPTYNIDVARELRRMIETRVPAGVYHLVNRGRASLWELMREIISGLGLAVSVEKGSYRDFPSTGRKNTCTPLRSVKLPALRPWQEAVGEYCRHLRERGTV